MRAFLGVLGSLSPVFVHFARGYDNGLALTPQMGWNTWNHFGCDISEDTIVGAAKALVSYNLTRHGYKCVFRCVLQLLCY
jgi:hypothetical protein